MLTREPPSVDFNECMINQDQPPINTFQKLHPNIQTDQNQSMKRIIHLMSLSIEALYVLQSVLNTNWRISWWPFYHYQHDSSDAHNRFSLFNSGDSLLRTEEITAQTTAWLFTRTCLWIFNGLLALRVWTNTSPPHISLHCGSSY